MMIDKEHSAVLDNQRITIRELSHELELYFGSVQSILTEDMGMKCISVKFVPKVLTVEQKETCPAVARDLLHCADQDTNFLKTLITGDESWVYGYDPETKAQSSQWKIPGSMRPKMACQVQSKVKVMLTFVFNYKGIVHHEYAPHGQTVNKEYYVKVLRWLHNAVRHK